MSAATPQMSSASNVSATNVPTSATGAATHPLAALIERAVAASKERASRVANSKSVPTPLENTKSTPDAGGTRGTRASTARDASATERPTDRIAERVFVSPRVVDARAFADYAASLKEVIREAGGHSRALQTVGVEVKGLQDRVTTSTKELQQKLELAARFLPTIDQRLQKAETIAGNAEKLLGDDAEALAAKVRVEMEHIANEAAAAAEKRVTAALEAALAKITVSADESAAKHAANADEAAATHAARLERIAQDTEDKRAQIAAVHNEALNELEERAAIARAGLHELTQQSTTAITATGSQLTAGLEPLLARGEAVIATLDTQVERVNRAAGEAQRWLTGQGIERLQHLMTLAESLAGNPEDPHRKPGVLVGLIDEARRIHDEAGKTHARLESLREQTEMARSILGEELIAATDRIDAVAARADQAKSRADEATRVADAAGTRVDGTLADADRASNAANEIAARIAELAASLATTKTKADEIDTLVAQAIDRARDGVEQAEVQTRERAAAAARESLEPIAARAAEIREIIDLRAMEVQSLIDQSGEALVTLDTASEKARTSAKELETRASEAGRMLHALDISRPAAR